MRICENEGAVILNLGIRWLDSPSCRPISVETVLVPIVQQTGWAPQLVWTLHRNVSPDCQKSKDFSETSSLQRGLCTDCAAPAPCCTVVAGSINWDWNEQILNKYINSSIEQSLLYKLSVSARQETIRILWNPKAHYRMHKNPPPIPILSQINTVHASTFCTLKIHFNIIFPPRPGLSKWSLSFGFPHQNPVCTSCIPIRAMCPAHLDMITRIIFREYRS